MDGTLAAIFVIAGLTDVALSDCNGNCLAKTPTTPRLSFQLAHVEFETAIIGSEAYVGYDFANQFGAFQPTIGASVTDQGDVWAGAGLKYTLSDIGGTGMFIESSLMPGVHFQGDGPDIGGNLQFRSALGLGYEFENGATIFAAYDHRSNADTLPINPGLETISIRYSIPLN